MHIIISLVKWVYKIYKPRDFQKYGNINLGWNEKIPDIVLNKTFFSICLAIQLLENCHTQALCKIQSFDFENGSRHRNILSSV